MLRIDILPAGHGDCLWIEYGDPQKPRRVLIDGGTTGTYKGALRRKLLAVPEEQRRFELLVVTHIDADHISGALELLEDESVRFPAADVWFNGYRHLPDEAPDTLGPVQGEKLTYRLLKLGVPWNVAFHGRAVVVPQEGDLPRTKLEGDLSLTLLAPTLEQLANLKPKWECEVKEAGLDPNNPYAAPAEPAGGFELLAAGPPDIEALTREPFSEDTAAANGSSIALLLDYEGHRVLLAGDAHPNALADGIRRLEPGKKLKLDACKLPHHGSKANVSPKLLDTLSCKRYVFSTNGAYFKHPDREAVARVIKSGGAGPELIFNYTTKYNDVWASAPLRHDHGYTTSYPQPGSEGAALEWD